MAQKYATWMPLSLQMLVDAGYWDDLTAEEQARYLAEEAKTQAAISKWERSWRGRWFRFTHWLAR